MPGDLFGLELAEKHRFSAEALNETIILMAKRSAIMRLATHDAYIGRHCGPKRHETFGVFRTLPYTGAGLYACPGTPRGFPAAHGAARL
jgi:hypothetical protein